MLYARSRRGIHEGGAEPMGSCEGRVALVTGASRGIGDAFLAAGLEAVTV